MNSSHWAAALMWKTAVQWQCLLFENEAELCWKGAEVQLPLKQVLKVTKKNPTSAFHMPWVSCLARTPSLHLSPGFRPSLARLWSDLLVAVWTVFGAFTVMTKVKASLTAVVWAVFVSTASTSLDKSGAEGTVEQGLCTKTCCRLIKTLSCSYDWKNILK